MKEHRDWRIKVAVALACALVGAVVLGPGAGVSVAVKPTTLCANELVALGPPDAEGNVDTTIVSLGCFDTHQQATSAAAANGNDVLIGKDFAWQHYNGDELDWYAANRCDAGYIYKQPDLGPNWNNRIGSADTAGGCNQWLHFAQQDYGLPGVTCQCYEMGDLNNRTSSEKWKHE